MRMHAQAATVTGIALSGTRTALLNARTAAFDRVEAETRGQRVDIRLEALSVEDAQWRPAIAAFEQVRSALRVWIDSIALAAAADRGEDELGALLDLLRSVVESWDPLVRALQLAGVDAPQLPAGVVELLGGLEDGS